MHIAIGYAWTVLTTGYHIERALAALGHSVTYVGLPAANRLGFRGADSIKEIVANLPTKPDCYLWVDSSSAYLPQHIEGLDIPTACYIIDVHLGKWRHQVARFFDVVFIAQKDYVDQYKQITNHDQVFWLPLAAASDMHVRHDMPKIYDVGFVGATGRSHQNSPRVQQLELIAQSFKINDFYKFYNPHEMSRVYSQSKIVFNSSIAGDITMRVFEGTACGSLLLTDSTKNGLEDLFVVGEQLVTYANIADAIAKIRYYIAHDEERERIADAGHQQTMLHHTYEQRAASIVEVISNPSIKSKAMMRTSTDDVRRSARREVMTQVGMLDSILDEARAAGVKPISRLWQVAPGLIRKLVR